MGDELSTKALSSARRHGQPCVVRRMPEQLQITRQEDVVVVQWQYLAAARYELQSTSNLGRRFPGPQFSSGRLSYRALAILMKSSPSPTP
jgi:hypothetical protein